ncbi:hypothetical protein NKR19_g9472 [Coniochaeta hoffmannii]|uniref:Uncharacterized protein n=1 Tax=Coniochaeta hoffmannii TaxID=91930 RepID=A0AA38VDG6_9PEZI|nr:hypothetical protein NKR19_g9472 [Coniochaeta hoffmannii]
MGTPGGISLTSSAGSCLSGMKVAYRAFAEQHQHVIDILDAMASHQQCAPRLDAPEWVYDGRVTGDAIDIIARQLPDATSRLRWS